MAKRLRTQDLEEGWIYTPHASRSDGLGELRRRYLREVALELSLYHFEVPQHAALAIVEALKPIINGTLLVSGGLRSSRVRCRRGGCHHTPCIASATAQIDVNRSATTAQMASVVKAPSANVTIANIITCVSDTNIIALDIRTAIVTVAIAWALPR